MGWSSSLGFLGEPPFQVLVLSPFTLFLWGLAVTDLVSAFHELLGADGKSAALAGVLL